MSTSQRAQPQISRRGAAALLVGPVVWFVFFLVAYSITGAACSLDFAHEMLLGFRLVRVLVVGAGLITAVIILATALHVWNRNVRLRLDADEEGSMFFDVIALLLCGASLVGTVWLSLTVLINPVC